MNKIPKEKCPDLVVQNTIILDGSIGQGEIERMIDNSFNLVVSKMTKKDQQSILMHLE